MGFAFQLASQHPYAEKFIGKPYVYTVDINNNEEVEEAVKEILQMEVCDVLLASCHSYPCMGG